MTYDIDIQQHTSPVSVKENKQRRCHMYSEQNITILINTNEV